MQVPQLCQAIFAQGLELSVFLLNFSEVVEKKLLKGLCLDYVQAFASLLDLELVRENILKIKVV